MRHHLFVTIVDALRIRVKAGRRGGAFWVRALDLLRLLPSARGRSQLFTALRHREQVHQTTADTAADRYPDLFDCAAQLAPEAGRILSFGCSTGEELLAIRARFPGAEIVGVEINPRSRSLAGGLTDHDPRIRVEQRVPDGAFDIVFALAVLQREPRKVAELDLDDLTDRYPFGRFDQAVRDLVARLAPGGVLCVKHAHYRVEDSSAARDLEPLPNLARTEDALFGADGRRLAEPRAATFFRKRC